MIDPDVDPKRHLKRALKMPRRTIELLNIPGLNHLDQKSIEHLAWLQQMLLGVVFTYIGDIIAYQHGLHFCQEVYPYRNQNKVSSNT
jgi:hypothetical protein